MKTIIATALMLTAASTMALASADSRTNQACDPAQNIDITNDAGEYLYSNSPDCRESSNGEDRIPRDVVAEDDGEEPDTDTDTDTGDTSDTPDTKTK